MHCKRFAVFKVLGPHLCITARRTSVHISHFRSCRFTFICCKTTAHARLHCLSCTPHGRRLANDLCKGLLSRILKSLFVQRPVILPILPDGWDGSDAKLELCAGKHIVRCRKNVAAYRKKCLLDVHRFEMGRQAANTKLSSNVSVRRVRVRGGNSKFRALRLDSGNFSWGSEAVTRKTRLLDVVYNSSNNELVSAVSLSTARGKQGRPKGQRQTPAVHRYWFMCWVEPGGAGSGRVRRE